MTSQVSVMSVFGVAVASDTVVTLTRGGQYKVVPNASKIIELGPEHKVLVLSSGNVYLNAFPHDLHITEWAKTLEGPLPRLSDYVSSYKAWSAVDSRLASPLSQNLALRALINQHILQLEDELLGNRANLEPTETQIRLVNRLDKQSLNSLLMDLKEIPDFDSLNRAELLAELKVAGINLREELKSTLSFVPELSSANLKLSVEVVTAAIGKAMERDSDSTLAFVGLGSEEPFVSLCRLNCCAVFAGALQSVATEVAIDPDSGNTGRIEYFAQADGIWAMVNGVHPELREAAADFLQELLEEALKLESSVALRYRRLFLQRMTKESEKRFVAPMFKTLGAYSITELASFADGLLASQLIASVFEDGQSSVGGVVEVATIDSRNGVIWHRRLPRSKLSSALGSN